MYQFLAWGAEKLKNFTLLDIGLFKTALLSFGFLLGMHAGTKMKKASPLIWLTFLSSFAALIYRITRSEIVLSEQDPR